MKKIFFIFTLTLLALNIQGEYIKLSNDMVLDTKNLLAWYDNGTVKGNLQSAINTCENLNGANSAVRQFGPWRVPNVNELFSIVDLTKTSPTVKFDFQDLRFGNNEDYWTSSVNINGLVASINFAIGNINNNNLGGLNNSIYNNFNVICVTSLDKGSQ